MQKDETHKLFIRLVIGACIVGLFFLGYFSITGKKPGELAYHAGNTYFTDKRYHKAIESYQLAVKENPKMASAYAGMANSMVQTKQFEEAQRYIEKAIKLEPKFGGHYATRGIVLDHMQRYAQAMKDYEQALRLYPGVNKGMGWLDRFFNKLEKAPPTIAKRLIYLKQQMKLPEGKRVLRIPSIDAQQIPYEQ